MYHRTHNIITVKMRSGIKFIVFCSELLNTTINEQKRQKIFDFFLPQPILLLDRCYEVYRDTFYYFNESYDTVFKRLYKRVKACCLAYKKRDSKIFWSCTLTFNAFLNILICF